MTDTHKTEPKSQTHSKNIHALSSQIQMLVLDVDGVMTDGSITYTSDGSEIKSFNVKDGLGIKLLMKAGVKVAIVTGRQSEIVEKRAHELSITHLMQSRDDKLSACQELSEKTGIPLDQFAYMGDDLPDLPAIIQVGFGITVADAPEIMKENADYVSEKAGGKGAVREICEFILDTKNELTEIQKQFADGSVEK